MTAADVAAAPVLKLLTQLHAALGTRAGQEEKWLDAPRVAEDPSLARRLHHAFRPAKPTSWQSNPATWLNTLDIDRVMQQYEASHPKFLYLGAVPRDFATRTWTGSCISPPMCKLTLAQLRAAGKTEFGAVFNMDAHDMPGSHWTACYGCVDPDRPERFGICYYDSVAREPPVEVQAFMLRVQGEVKQRMGSAAARRFRITYNGMRKQYANTECGVYAIFYLAAALTTNLPYHAIFKRVMMPDKDMQALRDVFFRQPDQSSH